ncbi:FtsX-like permease family protein [Desulfopila sp. IMCC35008]|uniref:FtsX-like permease family protein n=1 Tax=Desulfopila sp. IMCC35008 TaxID=2653858 RepID=UPI0013D21C05|nr:FtsX-like permease family protein [Desulfopila sp. IMCC35008]
MQRAEYLSINVFPADFSSRITSVVFVLLLLVFSAPATATDTSNTDLFKTVSALSKYDSRRTGSAGYEEAVSYIEEFFNGLGLETSYHYYTVPVRKTKSAELKIGSKTYPLRPFLYNAITPGATNGVLTGPLYYVGTGSFDELDGKDIDGAIVVMEFESGRNWQTLASLGARGLIYLDRGHTRSNFFFREKQELSPVQFPCFWLEAESTELTSAISGENGLVTKKAELEAEVTWQDVTAKNVYTVIPGSDENLKDELLILEAFFDNEELVAGMAPGADGAVSIATLLYIADQLVKQPPKRSVMLIASSGHAQTLAGMRELMWSINTRSRELRSLRSELKSELKTDKARLKLVKNLEFPLTEDHDRDRVLREAISQHLKFEIDILSRRLMQLRLENSTTHQEEIDKTAATRFTLRQLGWAEQFHNLPAKQTEILQQLLPKTIVENNLRIKELDAQLKEIKSASSFRSSVQEFDKIAAIVSLHLSSHGDGVGGFHRGFLYNLKPTINRTGIYSKIAEVLEASGETSQSSVPYRDTLRPSRMRSWQSWFLDKPVLGGEISSLAGNIGISLVTTGDARALWGTPWDTADRINEGYLRQQANLVTDLVYGMTSASRLDSNKFPRNGLSSATVRTNLLLQGELFADYPAQGTTILAYQGLNKFYTTVDRRGNFHIRGISDKKNVLDKLIIEGYRFDEKTGQVLWAIDKKETGKKNYRLKMLRKSMKTDLTMFSCKETTVYDLLEPRSFKYMTKLHLLDGRRDAPPQHFWYSRIDTRKSDISSIYLEAGSMLKMTLSDTVLTRKMLLTNSSQEKPFGTGFPVNEYDAIHNTVYQAAKDAWTLITPRIDNLESHGIFDEKINELKNRGLQSLAEAKQNFADLHFSTAKEASAEALALASRVYVQIEKTQKDVLFGVLFYIALFVPFAFCMERFLFNFATIYKRIVGFCIILVVLIAVIYQVHPAFQLTYSPMVVILAFFIIGLSLMVTLIIFLRFEEEMAMLQRRSAHQKPEEISRWKAFVAAFLLGVSNLRRRRIRTVLTCSTLIILTFTIMSFTTIKSNRQQTRLLFQPEAPYHGLLLKQLNWQSLPRQATEILVNSMAALNRPAPRVWMETADPTQTIQAPLRNGQKKETLQGLVGLSPNEKYVTGLDTILSSGRWFDAEDRQAIILEEETAKRLGVTGNGTDTVSLWGGSFTVIGTYPAEQMEKTIDLDGEPLTPVIFPEETDSDITEAEQEAIESGDDIRSFQSRYQHINASQIAIVPAATLLAAGGSLKNIAVRPENPDQLEDIASHLTDRFSLVIFSGEKSGVWLYNISDTLNYSGVPNIIIPLLISMLIVLNTMISSVYERKNEIGVYTSVGLAPSHVSFLFIAEAMALAVISVVLGYVIAQVSAALFSSTQLWQGITVNYSSLAGVAAMVLVIAVVLISVIYPSKVAASIAIPDVNRTFTLPKPQNDTISVTLPFLMRYDEHESIGGFIYDYFAGHKDVSHGIFSTGPIDIIFSCSTTDEIRELFQDGNGYDQHCLHLRANVWLAPFDFGIMQAVDVQFCPAAEGQDYLSIRITLKRKSGEAGIWHRINSVFLHDIRKQLLVWRSLSIEAHTELQLSFQQIVADKLSPEADE